jgi:hypothetical protein
MQFKNPELLYALFLLLIPIIIHLFQLRRFQKVAFTNVAFLKKVTIQTRKSSQLKKWLTLIMRLLALACIIMAFAQPFTASKTALNKKKESVLYVDNSFSMQAKGPTGPMLQRALQNLYEQPQGDEKLSWFTNNFSKKQTSPQDFKTAILNVPYVQKQLSPSEILLKANQLFSDDPEATKRLILISDFQQSQSFPEIPEGLQIDAIHVKPLAKANIAIDSVYIRSKSANTTQLGVDVSAMGSVPETASISLYNSTDLIAKSAIDFSDNSRSSISFDVENKGAFKGKLEITDANLNFDNTLFFSMNEPAKIKVLAINEAKSNFLQRIFDPSEFDYTQRSFRDLSYNIIPEQHLVILNELKEIPASLTAAIGDFVGQGGSLLIIPSAKINLKSYNNLLGSLQVGTFGASEKNEKKIAQIVFDHPLYQDVFEKRVVNFQYPKVNEFYSISSNATPALRFEDGKPFLLQKTKIYISTAAFNNTNSNFKSSPLIVPTLYNMAQQSLALPELYYEIGKQNQYSVPIQMSQDAILSLRDSTVSFIPLQQTKANQVNITTTDEPEKAAVYHIEKDNSHLQYVSYNYNRSESRLNYVNPQDWGGITIYESVDELFEKTKEDNTINSFWKWFAIFALLFLLLEMLILKYYR